VKEHRERTEKSGKIIYCWMGVHNWYQNVGRLSRVLKYCFSYWTRTRCISSQRISFSVRGPCVSYRQRTANAVQSYRT